MQEHTIVPYQHDRNRGCGRKRRNCSISRISLSKLCLCSPHFFSKLFSTSFWAKIFCICFYQTDTSEYLQRQKKCNPTWCNW